MVTVRFTSTLRELTGQDQVEIDAPNVRRLIRLLDERWPGLGERLTDGMSIAINGEIIPDAEFEDLPDGAEVHFIAAIAGG
jgi:molybdopterin converting factor small subunit